MSKKTLSPIFMTMRRIEEVSDINTKYKHDYTPATCAIINGHPSASRLLYEMGVDLGVRDRNGRSLVSHAAGNGYLGALRFLLSQNEQDVNSQDEAGRTAFSWATENGHYAVVRLLLENGADMGIKYQKMKTPRSHAIDNDKKAVV
jgi:ankyrin repeat protein